MLLRGPLSNPGHALFSAIWGLGLSKAKAAPNMIRARLPIVARGFLMASVLHSLFDLLLLTADRFSMVFFALLIAVMAALFFWVRSRIKFHSDTSPHREGTLYMPLRRYCQQCGLRGPPERAARSAAPSFRNPKNWTSAPIC